MRKILESVKRRFGGSGRAEAAPADAPFAAAAVPSGARAGKQAVILVHGMGEQIPMDTIRSFVRSVWENDPTISANRLPNPNSTWSKPDDRTGSLELRRITTRESIASPSWPGGVRTDFYELYWADLTAGSSWSQFVAWVRYLLLRPWSRVPKDVRSAWVALWVASAVVAVLALLPLLPESLWKKIGPIGAWRWVLVPLAVGAGAFVHHVATATFGRVVRYTRADPDNIAARAAIRKRGLDLLDALHRGTQYSRIVLVGHSLGTMLAYDLLSYYWAQRAAVRTIAQEGDEFAALCAVEAAAAALEAGPSDATRAAYRQAQIRLRKLLAARPPSTASDNGRWLISDLVTFGSPLTHAEFLIASSDSDLEERKRARELPTAPPFREALDPKVLEAAQATGALPIAFPPEATRLIAFPDFASPPHWILHHASPFAAVRWINVHDPSRYVFQGDVISGPLRPALGEAIEDVDLRLLRGQSKSFSHTHYWSPAQPPVQLAAVRRAVNLLDD
jgi:hypothetical protein